MKKLRRRKGISTVEMLCIIFLSVVAVSLIIMGLQWYRVQVRTGNDRMLVNTAESVARMNLVGHECMVKSCDGGVTCTHQSAGGYVGYFDHPTNSIQGTPGAGYNEYKVMTIGDRKYYGKPGTMVIRVVNHDGEPELSWVEGDNK